jgi:hypothetical protein
VLFVASQANMVSVLTTFSSCDLHKPEAGLCDGCTFGVNEPQIAAALLQQLSTLQKHLIDVHRVCNYCSGAHPGDEIMCESLDCPWFFARENAIAAGYFIPALEDMIAKLDAGNHGDEAEAQMSVQEGLPWSSDDEIDTDDELPLFSETDVASSEHGELGDSDREYVYISEF